MLNFKVRQVYYTEAILQDVLCQELEDSEIQLDLLGALPIYRVVGLAIIFESICSKYYMSHIGILRRTNDWCVIILLCKN